MTLGPWASTENSPDTRSRRPDLRTDSAIHVGRNFTRYVVEQLVAQTCRFVESAWRFHLRGHRELTGPYEDFDSDAVVLQRPTEPEAFVQLREPIPPQRADPRPAQCADEPPHVDVSRERG